MRFGAVIGCDLTKAEILKKVGYDFAEIDAGILAKISDDDFEDFCKGIKIIGIPCEAAYNFIPADIRVSDPLFSKKVISEYVEKALKRCAIVGVKTVVFASGEARNICEETDIHDGFNALLRFLSDIAAPIAEKNDIRIAVEGLDSDKSNVIHTVREAAALSKLAKSDCIKAAASLNDMIKQNDDISSLNDFGGSVIHAHTSNPLGDEPRYPTHDDRFDQKPFIKAVKKTGCMRISIDASINDGSFETDAAEGLYTLIDAFDDFLTT